MEIRYKVPLFCDVLKKITKAQKPLVISNQQTVSKKVEERKEEEKSVKEKTNVEEKKLEEVKTDQKKEPIVIELVRINREVKVSSDASKLRKQVDKDLRSSLDKMSLKTNVIGKKGVMTKGATRDPSVLLKINLKEKSSSIKKCVEVKKVSTIAPPKMVGEVDLMQTKSKFVTDLDPYFKKPSNQRIHICPVTEAVNNLEFVLLNAINLDLEAFSNRLLPKIDECRSALLKGGSMFEASKKYVDWMEKMVHSHLQWLNFYEGLINRNNRTFFKDDALHFFEYVKNMFVLSNSCLSDESKKKKMDELMIMSSEDGVDAEIFEDLKLVDPEAKSKVLENLFIRLVPLYEHVWCFISDSRCLFSRSADILFEHIRLKKDDDHDVVEVAKYLHQSTMLLYLIIKYMEKASPLHLDIWTKLLYLSEEGYEEMQKQFPIKSFDEDIDYSALLAGN